MKPIDITVNGPIVIEIGQRLSDTMFAVTGTLCVMWAVLALAKIIVGLRRDGTRE